VTWVASGTVGPSRSCRAIARSSSQGVGSDHPRNPAFLETGSTIWSRRQGALERSPLACRPWADATPGVGRRGRPLRAQIQQARPAWWGARAEVHAWLWRPTRWPRRAGRLWRPPAATVARAWPPARRPSVPRPRMRNLEVSVPWTFLNAVGAPAIASSTAPGRILRRAFPHQTRRHRRAMPTPAVTKESGWRIGGARMMTHALVNPLQRGHLIAGNPAVAVPGTPRSIRQRSVAFRQAFRQAFVGRRTLPHNAPLTSEPEL